ncbi:SGNH hydrolase domain-containing protein [Pseudomonas sp. 15FMM2]|uniref:SGNH hydrolase domain-containing protein n=1 Tax=Pseudomonas imrae TaxID=2992837 RepID=A0ACC7PAH5_9PSED
MHNKSLSYRPDIDGLRAIAVLAVVIFHFNKEWLPGGFVGVDIFFVISGFLITGIIARQVATGTFSFGEFYRRRVRRILPAALFVTISTLLFGLVFMLPDDAKVLSRSAIATTLSVANIYFWKSLDTSYFAASSDTVPLLHMWSLGVEEQFYLLWPALLLITYKLGGRALTVSTAVVLAIASFWYGQHVLISDPTFAYYMLPSRAGELLLGGLVFFACDTLKGKTGRIGAQAIGVVGAALLVWSLAFIRETAGFPGFISLAPSLGAALIIASGSLGQTAVGTVLSIRPMVAIGLVSFSLYLWHWPVLAFYRYAYADLSLPGGALCLAIMVVLTYASYKFIEVPFRSTNTGLTKTAAIPALALLTVVFSGVVLQQRGLIDSLAPKNYRENLTAHRDGAQPASAAVYVCQVAYKPALFSDGKCVFGDMNKAPKVLLIGDSNAAHFAGYLSQIAKSQGIAVRNVEHSACPPLPGNRSVKYVRQAYETSCPAYYAKAREEMLKYDTIIVGASWLSYQAQNKSEFANDIDALLDDLQASGKNVVVALKAPTFPAMDRQCPGKALKIPFLDCSSKAIAQDRGEMGVNLQIIEKAAGRKNISTFSVRDLICDGSLCRAFAGNTPLYYDGGHLSRAGSETLGALAVASGKVPVALRNLAQSDVTVAAGERAR